jgi:hypothetical protein
MRFPTRDEWRLFWATLPEQRHGYQRGTLRLPLCYCLRREKWRQTRPFPRDAAGRLMVAPRLAWWLRWPWYPVRRRLINALRRMETWI